MYSFIIPPKISIETEQTEELAIFAPRTKKHYHDKWIEYATLYDRVGGEYGATLFVWDASLNEFIYISPRAHTITGHDPEAYMGSEGMGFSLANIHPDYKAGTLLMMEKLYDFRTALDSSLLENGRFSASFDFAFRKKNGSYFRNLQYCMEVETTECGLPMMVLNYHFDISHLRKSKIQTLIIKTPAGADIFHFNSATQNLSKSKPVSKTEVHILALLATGMDTKQIANTIFTSPHTVDTHRRHLLGKFNCIDTTALVTYSRMVGLI